ncbi:MAG: ATP-binding protein [Microscillaceae bacterium]|jgi:predicted ATP-dependent endonuclease of OLD family|nr:ATP-binding protein [Microscillaceae bacterium]
MATENPKITHIERVEIKGLWGKYDIDWTLNRDVNILVGINGSGKSTVLDLLYGHITGYLDWIYRREFYGDIIVFSKNKKIWGSNSGKKYSSVHDSEFDLKADWVSTFDIDFQPLEVIQKLSNENVKTTLDWEIHNLITEYKGFKSQILNRVIETNDKSILDTDKKCQEIVNQAFSKTEKKILINGKSDINFQVGDKTLSPYELSSGEKQLLIILLKVLIQDNQPYILLMDEPEISLHLDWQEQLIDNIHQLNENCQIILATHSPAIFQKGHWDKITYMEDICKELIIS